MSEKTTDTNVTENERLEVKRYHQFLESQKGIQVKAYEGTTYLKSPIGVDEELEYYEKLRDEKQVIDVRFSAIDKKGELYVYLPNGIRLSMPSRNIDGFTHDPTYKEALSNYLCQDCPVIVMSVNREEKVVTVSMREATAKPRAKLLDALEQGIEEQVYVKILAQVVALSGKQETENGPVYHVAILNLGGFGVSGFVKIADWSPCFTKTLEYIVHVGDVIEVAVTGKAQWKTGMVYECKRAILQGDPWEGIEKRLPKNSTVRVKCIYKEKNRFFGSILGVPEIIAYCFYPEDDSVYITNGGEYLGYVSKCNEARKELKIRILSAVDEISKNAE